jgi:hypothetical protein
VYPEQQRYWVALLNLQRTWGDDASAFAFLPPRHRDFESTPDWPQRKAFTFLLNHLELIRESHRRLEAGETLDWEALGLGLAPLRLHLHAWRGLGDVKAASRAKADVGGRLETLQVTSDVTGLNTGTRYIKATVERALYYFALYVDARLADPAYPGTSAHAWRVVERPDGSGDLVLQSPSGELVPP